MNEEEVILRARQLDLIYSQSGILYGIIPEAPRPSYEAEKPKPGPHADGVVGSVNSPTIESLTMGRKIQGYVVRTLCHVESLK